jgi:transcriptional regulator with XRE-family HTH domain
MTDDDYRRRIGERLTRLIECRKQCEPNEKLTDIAARIRATYGVPLSDNQFWKIRTGKVDPQFSVLDAIAEFFGVPVSYFSASADDAGDERQARRDVAERLAGPIAARGPGGAGLGDGTRARIGLIVGDVLRDLEQGRWDDDSPGGPESADRHEMVDED